MSFKFPFLPASRFSTPTNWYSSSLPLFCFWSIEALPSLSSTFFIDNSQALNLRYWISCTFADALFSMWFALAPVWAIFVWILYPGKTYGHACRCKADSRSAYGTSPQCKWLFLGGYALSKFWCSASYFYFTQFQLDIHFFLNRNIDNVL